MVFQFDDNVPAVRSSTLAALFFKNYFTMTHEEVLRVKFRLLKSVLKDKYHLMLEDLAATATMAIEDGEIKMKQFYEKIYADILCGKDKYFRTPSMTKGIAYKIAGSEAVEIPNDATFIEISEAALIEMKNKK